MDCYINAFLSTSTVYWLMAGITVGFLRMVIESVSYTGKIRQPVEEPIASTEYHERSMMVSIRTKHAPFISIRLLPPVSATFSPTTETEETYDSDQPPDLLSGVI